MVTAVTPRGFDEALREAIQAKGLSLERLQARLRQRGIHVSLASLSNWQRGICRPERSDSLKAIHALEEILGLGRDGLVTLIGPKKPRGRWLTKIPGALTWDEICPNPVNAQVDRLLADLPNPTEGRLGCLSYHECFTVGPDREERNVRTRIVFQARADGADRHVAVHHNECSELPDIRNSMYCRPGRIRTDEEGGLTAVELLFDRPLMAGETYIVEYEFAYSKGGPESTYYHRWFRFPAREYVLQVQFDSAAAPIRCYRTWQASGSKAPVDSGELRLSRWNTVHIAQLDVLPSVHGIRWEWH